MRTTEYKNPALKPLTFQEIRFVDEYMVDMNAQQAIIRAGYPPLEQNKLRKLAIKLMDRVAVKEEINKRLAARRANNEVTVQKIQSEIAALAFANAADFYNEDGSTKLLSELDERQRKAVTDVIKRVVRRGRNSKPFVEINYKIADKLAALQVLARSFGMFQDNVNIKDKTDPRKMTDDQLDRVIADLVTKAGAGSTVN